MKELSTEEVVEIRDRIRRAENPQREAMNCIAEYDKLDDARLLDLLGASSFGDIPTGPWPEGEPAPARKKRGPKPGTKKSPKTKPPVCETAPPAKPKAPKTVVLTAESAKIVADYLEGSLQRDIREALGGEWTLNDLRLLLFVQNMLATAEEG